VTFTSTAIAGDVVLRSERHWFVYTDTRKPPVAGPFPTKGAAEARAKSRRPECER
jgi:hypothetical protein